MKIDPKSRSRHPQLTQDLTHGAIANVDPTHTRYHGARAPILPDRSIDGPFGPCTITKRQYEESLG